MKNDDRASHIILQSRFFSLHSLLPPSYTWLFIIEIQERRVANNISLGVPSLRPNVRTPRYAVTIKNLMSTELFVHASQRIKTYFFVGSGWIIIAKISKQVWLLPGGSTYIIKTNSKHQSRNYNTLFNEQK